MCSPKRTEGQSIKKVSRNLLKPVSAGTKVRQIAANMWIRVSKLQTCCGHPGQAGC